MFIIAQMNVHNYQQSEKQKSRDQIPDMYLLSLLETPLKFVREMVTEITSAKTEMIFDRNWLFGPRSWASDLVQTASK